MDRTQTAIIQWECQQLLNRVVMLMDACDWEALAELYTEDGVLFRPSDSDNGVEGRAAILASFHARPPRASCHMVSNAVFDVQSENCVRAQSRVWLVVGDANAPKPTKAASKLAIGSFDDTLAREDGQWKIKLRRGGIELMYDYAD